jgi:hypothetical protein
MADLSAIRKGEEIKSGGPALLQRATRPIAAQKQKSPPFPAGT